MKDEIPNDKVIFGAARLAAGVRTMCAGAGGRCAALLLLFSVLCPLSSAPAANLVTSVLTITNLPQTSNVFYFASSSSSSLRTWTNQTTASLILTNLAGLGPAATNLFNALGNYTMQGVTVSQTNTNTLVFKGVSLVVTQGGNWASIITTTNSGTNTYSFVGNFDYLPLTTRTNQASEMVYGLGIYPTNALPTNAAALANFANLFTVQTISNKNIYASHYRGGDIGASPTGTELFRGNLLYYSTLPDDQGNGFYFADKSTNYKSRIWANSNGVPGLIDAGTLTALDPRIAGKLNDEVILNWFTGRQLFPILVPFAGDDAGNFAIDHNTFSIPNTFTMTNTFNSDVWLFGNVWSSGAGSVLLTNVSQAVKNQTVTNQTVLSGSQSNVTSINCSGTNTLWSGSNRVNAVFFNRLDLATLADGNNISVLVGTNQFVRITQGGLTTGATICGLIGAGASGSADGHYLNILNDSTLNATFAQNTVDPVPANRITTQSGADVVIPNKGTIELEYESTTARWRVRNVYPQTNFVATATNAMGNSSSFGTNETLYQQTVIASGGALIASNLTASRALLVNAALQVTNEPDATLANLSSLTIKNYTNALTSLRTNSVSVGSVTGVNWGNGITGTVASGQANLGVSIDTTTFAASGVRSTNITYGSATLVTVNANVYKYVEIAQMNSAAGSTNSSGTSSQFSSRPAFNCTFTRLGFTAAQAPGVGTNYTVTLQTNNVDTAVTLTLTGDGSTTYSLASGNSVSVTTNDLIGLRFTVNQSAASMTYHWTTGYTVP